MSGLSPEVAEALAAVDRAPAGGARVAEAEDALLLAQRTGLFADELAARLAVARAYYYVPEPPENFVQFVWLRRALDHPECTGEQERHEILWLMKWAMSRMMTMPTVSLHAIEQLQDDVERIFVREGFQLRPVLAERIELALARGDVATSNELLARWKVTPRDSMSDCHACEIRSQSRQVASADLRAALESAAPVVDGLFSCAHEPHRTLADAAMWHEELGQVEEAVALHRRGWPLVRQDPLLMTAAAKHLVVLTRLGNLDRALPQLLARLSWADEPIDARSQLDWLTASAFVLGVAVETGAAPDQVRGRKAAQALDDVAERARTIAAAFDARNGSSAVSDRMHRWLDRSRLRAEPTLPPVHVVVQAPQEPVPGSSGEFVAALEQARDQLDGPRSQRLRMLWRDRRGEVVTAETPTPEVLLHRAELDRLSAREGRAEDARRLLQSSIAAAANAAQSSDDRLEIARAAAAVLHGEAERAVLEVREAQDEQSWAEALAEAGRLATTLESMGALTEASSVHGLLSDQLEGADAVAELREAVRLSRADPHPVRTPLVVDQLARALVDTDPGEARILLARAAELADRRPRNPVWLRLTSTAAALAEAEGDLGEALQLVEQVADASDQPVSVPARSHGLRLLSGQREWPRVESRGRELITIAAACGDAVVVAETQHTLGVALAEQGLHTEAAEVLELALPVLSESGSYRIGPAHWMLGETLVQLGQFAEARTAFASAAAAFEAMEASAQSAYAQHQAGQAALQLSDELAADSHFEAAERLASADGVIDLYVQVVRDRADLLAGEDLHHALIRLDGLPAAVGEVADEHGTPRAELNLAWLEAAVLHQGAMLLGAHGQPERALTRLNRAASAAHRAEWDSVMLTRMHANRAELLADAERFEEAETAIRALPTLEDPGFLRARRDAVAALARGLDWAGQTDRAEQLWQELSGE